MNFTCERCGKSFESHNKGARFCGRECLYASMRLNVTLDCEHCGQTFTRKPWEITKGREKYCSQACFHAAQVGQKRDTGFVPEERPCVACGTLFKVGGRGNHERDVLYCSAKCARAARYRRPHIKARQLSEPEAAYLAGIVDGEGSIMLFMRRDVVAMRLAVANSKWALHEWVLARTACGGIFDQRAATTVNAQSWIWHCDGEQAESVLRQIRPYLVLKQSQADLAIETQERLRDPALKADRSWHDEYRQRMKALNLRGPG